MWRGVVSERKISKRLKLIKRVREVYTRKDVPCGFKCCGGRRSVGDAPLVVPTADVLVKYRALFRSGCVSAVICQSVLGELSRNDEKKVRDVARRWGYPVFCDEFCESTHGRGLESVAEFYRGHLGHKVVVLDAEGVREFGKSIGAGDLLELVEEQEETRYSAYDENLEVRWKRGEICRGSLQVSTHNCYSGFVMDGSKKILVVGKTNMNRAMHGDEVYVEMTGECEEDMILEDAAEESMESAGLGRECGRVVGIHQRRSRTVVGTVLQSTVHGHGVQNVLVLPIDRRIPPVRIRTGQVDELANRRLCIEIDGWETTSNYPVGHYYRRLGEMGCSDVEREAILVANEIDHQDEKWPEEDFGGLERAYQEVKDGQREDFRGLHVMSIDPPRCTDIDDALHFRTLRNGNIEVGVHIADVTLYVDRGSVLDRMAADRGTTVYLPGMRIDMLPPALSTDLCSLVEGKDRAAFSVMWELSKDIRVLKTRFCRSLIRSRRALSYEEADRMIRGKEDGETCRVLRGLCRISKVLRQRRFDNGSLDLSSKEIVFRDGGFDVKEQLQTNFLVEEFMLLANTTAAAFIQHHCPDRSLLRRHPPSSDGMTSADVNELLGALEGARRDIARRSVVRAMNQAVYFVSGSNADFRHYGLALPIYTHFTSPIRRYADVVVHRILDSILHEDCNTEEIAGLGAVSFLRRAGVCAEPFVDENTCRGINRRHRSAKRAAWECNRLAMYLVLREREPAAVAYVVDTKPNGVLLYVPDYNIEEAVVCSRRLALFDAVCVRVVRDDSRFFLRQRFHLEIE